MSNSWDVIWIEEDDSEGFDVLNPSGEVIHSRRMIKSQPLYTRGELLRQGHEYVEEVLTRQRVLEYEQARYRGDRT